MPAILHDLRYALRTLGKNPGFTSAAILTLALGIGGNAAIFSIVDRVVLRDLPFPDSRRLVRIHDAVLAMGEQVYRTNVTALRWQAIASSVPAFDRVTAQRPDNLTWIGSDFPVAVSAASVSSGTFPLFGVSPVLGRLFRPEEQRLGDASGVVLVSERFWRTRLSGDRRVIGSFLRFGDGPRTVVGVIPEGFHFPYRADIWLPLSISPGDRREYLTIARLSPGTSLERAQEQLNLLARRLESSDSGSRNHSFDAMWLKKDLLRDQERVPLALLAAVGFLLALGCANLSALLLAKSVARRREMAIRAALGASGGRQIRQLLTESLLLAIPAGAIGLTIAIAARRPLFALVPQVLGEELQYRAIEISSSLVVFTFALSGAVAMLFGLAPALRASRENPATALGGGERSATAARNGRQTLSLFVIGEIALATTLLAGATLMIADLAQLQTQPLGISPRGLLSMEVPLSAVPDPSGEDRNRKIRALVDAVRTVPGVRSAAATTVNPFWGGTWGIGVGPAGRIDPGASLPTVNFRMTTPGLLRTNGTALIAGRDFTEDDRDGSAAVAIVSRRLASRLWPGTPAVGQDLVRRASDGSTLPMRVVGVAEDVRDAGDLEGAVYLPCAQLARQVELERIYIMARGTGPSGPWIREAARAVGRIDPRLAVAEAETMDVLHDRTIAQSRLGTTLLAAVAAFGLLLGTMGIYTVVAFTAGERRLEFAIRTALGAVPAEIRRLILRQGLVLGIAGCGAGLALALALNRLLARALHGFPSSLWLPVSVALLLFAATLAASSVPALRAARINPSDTLRSV